MRPHLFRNSRRHGFLRQLVLCCLFLNCPSLLLAQNRELKFERLSYEQGLSQNAIFCMLQDHKGFMWFGTEAGLNKYDGYQFTIYKNDPHDSTSISDNWITSLFEDHTGSLWVGTPRGGLNRFDRDKEQFTHFGHDPENLNTLSNNGISIIYEDRAGTLWIGTALGLNRFDREKALFTRFIYNPHDAKSLLGNRITAIHEDHGGTLWIGTERGLNKLDRDKDQFTSFTHEPRNPHSISSGWISVIREDRSGILWIGTRGGGINRFERVQEQFIRFAHDQHNPHSLSNGEVLSIHEDRAGTLWIATPGGLNRFERDQQQFTRFVHDPKNPHSLGHDWVRAFHEDQEGTLWIGTAGGLDQFDREKQQFIHFVNDPQDPHSLSFNTVWGIYEDRSGALWFGTNFGGINKFDRGQERFTNFFHDPNNPNSLSHPVVWSFCEDPDSSNMLWIGTGLGGLNRFDRKIQRFKHFVHDPKNPQSISNNVVRSIIIDHTGTLWLGTENGLNKFDRKTERFTRFINDPKNPQSLSHNFVLSIYEDHTGTLWIGTFDGLNKYDREKKQFTRYVNDPQNPNSLSHNTVFVICEDRAGALWIGTLDGGLNKFDREKEQFTRFVHDPKNPHSLSHNTIGEIYEDLAGTFWIGTDGGLDKFDSAKQQFIHYTMKDGLPDNNVGAMLEDNHGRLWVSTLGLSRFDPKTASFRNYYINDGVQKEITRFASCRSKSGEMFFGGTNGFNVFHPDSIKDNPYIPPVVITSFKRYNIDDAAGVGIVEKGISAKKEIEVSYKDNVLSFEFAALSYRNTFKNQYAYKLEGYSDQWIQLGTERRVSFTNLDPGDYTLRVKGSNNDGVWNEEGTSLKIIVTPPWWQTSWAYAGYVMLFGAALYGWRRFELNRVKLRNEVKMKNFEAQKLQEMDHMKSRFFANISHEFRTPLTLILGPLEQLQTGQFSGNVKEVYAMMLRNGQRLLRLINQLLDLARLEAGRMSLQARPENIVSFLKGLVLSFASAAERKRIALTISAEEENLIVYFDRDKLEKIVSNLLSNALKFTPEGGRVSVQLTVTSRQSHTKALMTDHRLLNTGNWLLLTVTDTGPGIPVEQLDKIFDRFYQVDPSHTREHEGTGIGLALTKELVELHHGEILVQSEVGRGTTFIVRLPLGKEHLRAEEVVSDQLSVSSEQSVRIENRESRVEDRVAGIEQPSLQHSTTPSLQEPTTSDEPVLLIVEDNRDVCTYIRQYLEPEFKVLEAHDGGEGVEMALESIPDLIITDVMMPKRDGNELCRILKTDEKTSHVPIIMLTAKADSESKVQGLETGADDYLVKPFDSKELLVRAHNLIKQRRQLRERFSREIVLKPQDIAITPMDEVFLNKVKAVVEKYMGEEGFEVETLSREVGMSRAQLHRKLKALTDQSASQFIRSLRLQRAVELLKQNAGTIAEIAYQVGFGSQAYFTTCFHEQFGCSPKEFAKKNF